MSGLGQPALKTDGQWNQKPEKFMPILLDSFFGFLRLDPAVSSIIWFHKFVQAFDTLKILEHCFGTQDTLKKVILPEHFASNFS